MIDVTTDFWDLVQSLRLCLANNQAMTAAEEALSTWVGNWNLENLPLKRHFGSSPSSLEVELDNFLILLH